MHAVSTREVVCVAKIVLDLSEADFERMTLTSMEWAGHSWESQADRFETASQGANAPLWDWDVAYWVGDQWVNVIMCRAFLDAQGHSYEVVWDMVENPDPSFVILTSYRTKSWKGE